LRGRRAAQRALEDAAFREAFAYACHAQLRAHGLCVCDDEDTAVEPVTLKPDDYDPLKAEVDGILAGLGDRARGPLGERLAKSSPGDYFLSPKFETPEEEPEVIPDGPVADAIDAFLSDPSTGVRLQRPVRHGVTANVPPDLESVSEHRTTT
jgi:hypothetical protein